MFRFAATAIIAACLTTGAAASDLKFNFGRYVVTAERTGCALNNAQIISRDLTIPFYTYHTLVIGVNGTTSDVYEVNCEPVMAGGRAMCTSNSMSMRFAAATAGLGCGGWNQFNMVRN